MHEDKFILTPEEAKSLLPDGDTVQTVMNPATDLLLGCDYDRADAEATIDANKCEVAGPEARKFGHALAIHTPHGVVFVEAVEERIVALEEKRKATP